MSFQKYKINKISTRYNRKGILNDLDAEITITETGGKTIKASVTVPNEQDRIAYQKGTKEEKAAILTKHANRVARVVYKEWADKEGFSDAPPDKEFKKDAYIEAEIGVLEVTDISKTD